MSVKATNSAQGIATGQSYEKPDPARDAARIISNNETEALRIQAGTQRLAIDRASLTGDMQRKAFLTSAMDGMDTKLQVALVNFKQDVFVESNRHVEDMAGLKLQAMEARLDDDNGSDIPAPKFD